MPANPLPPEVISRCAEHEILIDPKAEFFGRFAAEAPSHFKPGVFDVELLGAFSYLGDHHLQQGSLVRHVGTIGRFCSIAGNVAIGPREHPTDWVSAHTLFYGAYQNWNAVREFRSRNMATVQGAYEKQCQMEEAQGKVQIGNDVWIGEGAFIRRGVSIGDGAIVGGQAVVTKDVPPYAIVGGAPAKIIRYRFEPDVIEALLGLQWWLYGMSAMDGVDFTDIDLALWRISQNIESGRAEPFQPPVLEIGTEGVTVYRYDPSTGRLAA